MASDGSCELTSTGGVCLDGLWEREQTADVTSGDVADLSSANLAFALEAYRVLSCGAGATGNVLFSPLALSLLFGMLYSGARGGTAARLSQVLHFDAVYGVKCCPALHAPVLHDAFNVLDLAVRSRSGGGSLALATAIWIRDGLRLVPRFAATCVQQYGEAVRVASFGGGGSGGGAAAAAEINAWCNNATDGQIPLLLSPADGQEYQPHQSVALVSEMERLPLALTSAAALDAAWAFGGGFDEAETRLDAPFTTADGTVVGVMQMVRRRRLAVYDGSDFVAVELPYSTAGAAGGGDGDGGGSGSGSGRSRGVSLVVIVPDAGVDVGAWGATLCAGKWRALLASLADAAAGADDAVADNSAEDGESGGGDGDGDGGDGGGGGGGACVTTLAMPRLDLAAHHHLLGPGSALDALGLPLSDMDDLSGLTSQAGVGARAAAVHAVRLSVAERGSGASAAASSASSASSAASSASSASAASSIAGGAACARNVTVDRPFLLAVVDRPSESLLFLGRVIDPTAAPTTSGPTTSTAAASPSSSSSSSRTAYAGCALADLDAVECAVDGGRRGGGGGGGSGGGGDDGGRRRGTAVAVALAATFVALGALALIVVNHVCMRRGRQGRTLEREIREAGGVSEAARLSVLELHVQGGKVLEPGRSERTTTTAMVAARRPTTMTAVQLELADAAD